MRRLEFGVKPLFPFFMSVSEVRRVYIQKFFRELSEERDCIHSAKPQLIHRLLVWPFRIIPTESMGMKEEKLRAFAKKEDIFPFFSFFSVVPGQDKDSLLEARVGIAELGFNR